MKGKSKQRKFDERWKIFNEKYSTERACEERLFRFKRWPAEYSCPECEGEDFYIYKKKEEGGKRIVYQCKNPQCRYQASARVRTIFESSKTPLKKWFRIIFLISQRHLKLRTTDICRLSEMKNYKTVWLMRKKIEKWLVKRPEKLCGIVRSRKDLEYWSKKKRVKR